MREPILSVVIPTFNTASMTLDCCRSALAVTPPGSEIIVVDDGSSDDTMERIRAELPSVTLIRLESNRGYSTAVNAGASSARGRILLLLNSDVTLDADAAAHLLEAFECDPKLGVAGAQLRNADGSPQWSGGRFPTLAWLFVATSGVSWLNPRRGAPRAGHVDWVSGAVMAIRWETWQAVGPMETCYRFYSQDLGFCTRAAAAGWKIAIPADVGAVHALGATIRRITGVDLPNDPERQWPDLLQWALRHRSRAWSVLARMTMIAGAALRIAGRSAWTMFLRGEKRTRYAVASAAYIRGLRALME